MMRLFSAENSSKTEEYQNLTHRMVSLSSKQTLWAAHAVILATEISGVNLPSSLPSNHKT